MDKYLKRQEEIKVEETRHRNKERMEERQERKHEKHYKQVQRDLERTHQQQTQQATHCSNVESDGDPNQRCVGYTQRGCNPNPTTSPAPYFSCTANDSTPTSLHFRYSNPRPYSSCTSDASITLNYHYLRFTSSGYKKPTTTVSRKISSPIPSPDQDRRTRHRFFRPRMDQPRPQRRQMVL